MMKLLGRILLAFSAILLAIGAWIHTSAFNKMSAAVAKSDLIPFAAKSLRILWLEDSVVLLVLAVAFAVIAAWASVATKWIIVLLALIPAATAALVYYFAGTFIAGHILLTAAIAAILGGLQYPVANRP
jgi:hypothetical protein